MNSVPFSLCFVIGGIGGPRELSALFTGPVRSDTVYIVFQRLTEESHLDKLVDCLRTQARARLLVAQGDTDLVPGTVYFLAWKRGYLLDGNRLKVNLEPGAKPLDALLQSGNAYAACLIALSGFFLEGDGFSGMRRFAARGHYVFGVSAASGLNVMVQELERQGLLDGLFPAKQLLEKVAFGPAAPAAGGSSAPLLLAAPSKACLRELAEPLQGLARGYRFAFDGLDVLRALQQGDYAGLVLEPPLKDMETAKLLESVRALRPGIRILLIGKDGEGCGRADRPLEGEVFSRHFG